MSQTAARANGFSSEFPVTQLFKVRCMNLFNVSSSLKQSVLILSILQGGSLASAELHREPTLQDQRQERWLSKERGLLDLRWEGNQETMHHRRQGRCISIGKTYAASVQRQCTHWFSFDFIVTYNIS